MSRGCFTYWFPSLYEINKEWYPNNSFDNFNSYYDPNLKERESRITKVSLEKNVDFKLITGDLSDKRILKQIFLKTRPSRLFIYCSSGC